jgi:hypothetical protein
VGFRICKDQTPQAEACATQFLPLTIKLETAYGSCTHKIFEKFEETNCGDGSSRCDRDERP